jgi:hypothetical protein
MPRDDESARLLANLLAVRIERVLTALYEHNIPRDAMTANALLTTALVELRTTGSSSDSILNTVRRTLSVPIKIVRLDGKIKMVAGCAWRNCGNSPDTNCGRCYVPLCASCVVPHSLACAAGELDEKVDER